MVQESDRSHLFVVRVWTEPASSEPAMTESDTTGRSDDPPLEIRGRVQHALSGETRHFRDWSTLIEFLIIQLEQVDSSDGESDVE